MAENLHTNLITKCFWALGSSSCVMFPIMLKAFGQNRQLICYGSHTYFLSNKSRTTPKAELREWTLKNTHACSPRILGLGWLGLYNFIKREVNENWHSLPWCAVFCEYADCSRPTDMKLVAKTNCARKVTSLSLSGRCWVTDLNSFHNLLFPAFKSGMFQETLFIKDTHVVICSNSDE